MISDNIDQRLHLLSFLTFTLRSYFDYEIRNLNVNLYVYLAESVSLNRNEIMRATISDNALKASTTTMLPHFELIIQLLPMTKWAILQIMFPFAFLTSSRTIIITVDSTSHC